ncbi:helix-turn-helix transcriptional regulator [Bacillus thuringiensis]|uniref:helix-turn-helix domain-containing protein n=1 Tax=Bacillus thuringiensis TaxID=1428 RepID=UPI000A3BBB46|nr:helix-turn-helix transcriptional regulator [Bacillus thuringiensis]MED3352763.1 helix-turn-helix transcriptional regulator [Bacillus thuringiensis]MRB09990.1 helix-turn-helix domain-containing protein [Bacillus thuringiensis]OTW83502.1 transcriptional regulator [Bacillus thuringiensis serovar sumiyoshiensis]OTW93156.1 transcriptional regulator [Bacillus thuringiensis serovar fukuokaensis]PGW17532.1 XRE family transcriptional regulator [Bacillus thuringiensis]
MEIPKAFGELLRQHRKKANLSQEQLALQCNLDRTYIGLLERAQRQPSISTIFVICKVLNIAPHELIKEIEELISSQQ